MEHFLETCLGLGWLQGNPWAPGEPMGTSAALGRGFLPQGNINWSRLIGLISCAGPTGPSLVSRSPCSQHPLEPPHIHGPLLMRNRHNRWGFYAGIWPPGPPAAPSAEMWGFGTPWGRGPLSCCGLPCFFHGGDNRPQSPQSVP